MSAPVVFYTLVQAQVLLFPALCRLEIYPDDVAVRTLIGFGKMLFVGSGYWYFAAYTALFLLLPIINPLLLSLNRRRYTYLMLVLIAYLTVSNAFQGSCFYGNGYNMTWQVVMY